ncbi:hypothetical protein G3M81_12495 [Bacillus paralicheniformis]|uniref:hypothetical protein n=1 Tax=Bacillus TaxID=1386 RepID=UPI0013EF52A0|nr:MULTISPECIES: hypothetical protein [Bacillus]MCY8609923.1 hypothetical protein [Bacillus haynesii]MEC0752158.1 hypothetical protein [Bacillus haynesii]QII49509.1 hypothetical protein G3M81_12495 [Bacillus paralicheniformis]
MIKAKIKYRIKPSRRVGVIARKPKGHSPGQFNPLILHWSVNGYRKDYNQVIEQAKRSTRLPAYEQSLFEHTFKKWRESNEQEL